MTQNNPNPFNGTTNVNLMVTKPGAVTLEMTDINGRATIDAQNFTHLSPGIHQFRINVTTAGIYFLTARQNGETSSIKMVNNGNGPSNAIEFEESVPTNIHTQKGIKSAINQPFTYGDVMIFKGFAEENGIEFDGELITQSQSVSEEITLVINFKSETLDGIPCPTTPTITDVDNNIYNTVMIGNQCWMKENLKTTKYADGTVIPQGTTSSSTTAYWYYPNNNSFNKETYGLLYNWKAVMKNSSSSNNNPSGVQGICPNGWHVPSDAEWIQLTNYVSSVYPCDGNITSIAKALADTINWNRSSTPCAIGNTPSSNNATGFSALPAGTYYGSYYLYFGNSTDFWSTTQESTIEAYNRYLDYFDVIVKRDGNNKDTGNSVRCIRD